MAGYTVKITIEDTHPPVWRRITLPDSITFYDLHRIIQTAFGWRDCHLHEFRTSDDICISNPDADLDGYELNEKSTTIDEFLTASWIRYTYDFGDDWRHKIVFEKEDPLYDKRYAGIIKAKGDNFREDSHWDEDNRIPFSAENTNADLERMTFRPAKPSKQQKEKTQRIQDNKAMSDTLDMIHKLLKNTGQPDMTDLEILTAFFNGTLTAEKLLKSTPPKARETIRTADSGKMSKAAQAAEKWYQFADAMEAWEDTAPGHRSATTKRPKNKAKSEDRYEQLTIPGLDVIEKPQRTEILPNQFPPDAYRIDVVKSSKSAADLMTGPDAEVLSDFCKYSAIDPASWSGNVSKKRKIALILDTFRLYPECLCYIFSKEEYLWIRTWCFAPGINLPLKDGLEAVGKLLHLGLAKIHLWMESGTEVAELSVASDLDSFFPVQKNRQLKKTYGVIEQERNTLLALLALYGVTEIENLFELYPDSFPSCRTAEDFQRFVYWHLRINDHVSTATDLFGTNYIIHPDLEPQTAMQQFAEHHDLPYRIFTEDEIDLMRHGLCSYYTEWELYFTGLIGPCDLSPQEANHKVVKSFIKMQNGCLFDELYAEVRANEDIPAHAGIEEEAELWATTMGLMMETAVILFHGHTRYEAMEEWNYGVDELKLFSDRKWKKPAKTTHIADMQPAIQIRLHNICQDPEPSGSKYDEILKEIGCANYEIRYLLIHDLIADDEFDRAEAETKALYRETHDKDIKNLLNDIDQYRELALDAEEFENELFGDEFEEDPFGSSLYGDGFFGDAPFGDSLFGNEPFGGGLQPWAAASTPYRREQPKIGRNDPCPCGSGKKYKQCCGK